EQVVRRRGRTDAGVRGRPANELCAFRPPGDVLVAALRVADEGDFLDVDAEQMEPRLLRAPSENGDGFAVARPRRLVVDGDGPAPHFDLAFFSISGRDDAVDE